MNDTEKLEYLEEKITRSIAIWENESHHDYGKGQLKAYEEMLETITDLRRF